MEYDCPYCDEELEGSFGDNVYCEKLVIFNTRCYRTLVNRSRTQRKNRMIELNPNYAYDLKYLDDNEMSCVLKYLNSIEDGSVYKLKWLYFHRNHNELYSRDGLHYEFDTLPWHKKTNN